MKRLGVFMLPPGWDASPSQGYPQHYAGTHLYTWVERSTVRVKCLAQEHNTMSPTRSRTRTTRPGVQHTNHVGRHYTFAFLSLLKKATVVAETSRAIYFFSQWQLFYSSLLKKKYFVNGSGLKLFLRYHGNFHLISSKHCNSSDIYLHGREAER